MLVQVVKSPYKAFHSPVGTNADERTLPLAIPVPVVSPTSPRAPRTLATLIKLHSHNTHALDVPSAVTAVSLCHKATQHTAGWLTDAGATPTHNLTADINGFPPTLQLMVS